MTSPDVAGRLTRAQRAALRRVAYVVESRRADARARLTGLVRDAGCSPALLETAMECVRRHARVVVHFHPDRVGAQAISVAQALLRDGRYRGQFETGLSSGSLTAFPGGPRDEWERALFGGAYHRPDAAPEERPKYGALEIIRHPDGPWPRFGSCYLVLRQDVSRRASFTFSGSEQPDAAERLGTIEGLECVMVPLLAEVANGARARVPWPPFEAATLGVERLTVKSLLERLSRDLPRPRSDASHGPAGRVLDTGIEAQVHGPIDLRHDVERLVADPAFAGNPTGDLLEALCREHAIELDWHCGFRLAARDVPDAFRGPAVARLARRIARDGLVDAAVIGDAQASLRLAPERWRDLGPADETLQHLKQLWHVVVHFGAPVVRSPSASGR